jgi:hypothetical protein
MIPASKRPFGMRKDRGNLPAPRLPILLSGTQTDRVRTDNAQSERGGITSALCIQHYTNPWTILALIILA